METTTIEDKIRKYISENFLFSEKGYPYADDASFLEYGVIDSMNVMELVMFVEGSFGVTVRDDEITPQNFDSVSDLTRYIRSKA